jgi:hypothetical protein
MKLSTAARSGDASRPGSGGRSADCETFVRNLDRRRRIAGDLTDGIDDLVKRFRCKGIPYEPPRPRSGIEKSTVGPIRDGIEPPPLAR